MYAARAVLRQFTVVILLAGASLVGQADQSGAPVQVRTPGAAVPRLVTFIRPEYPQIALSARVSGDVQLEATIGLDGVVRDLRVRRSIPLLDQAALDAVRRWRFEPPMVRGVPAPVSVPIHVMFRDYFARPTPPLPKMRSASLPPDYTVVFASNCLNGGELEFNTATKTFVRTLSSLSVRADLWFEAPEVEAIHAAIVKTGLLDEGTRLSQWPDTPPDPEVSEDGIRVVVQGLAYVFTSVSDGPTPRQYYLAVRMNGTWTRLSPPTSWPDPPAVKFEQRIRDVIRQIQKLVQSFPHIRKLPSSQQCR